MNHLDKITQGLLNDSIDQKINQVRSNRWINYPKAKEVMFELEQLLNFPRIHRMPSMLLVGDTNNGKSMIINRFKYKNEPFISDDEDYIKVPVLLIQAPPTPDENRFYSAILDDLFVPHRPNGNKEVKQTQVINVLRKLKTKVLIIDEFHHILAGTVTKQRVFLNVIKYISNELSLSIVAAGTNEVFTAINTDPQLANRFIPQVLSKWHLDDDFRRLLSSFESILPLPQPSYLYSDELAIKILSLSEGTIGEIANLLKTACIYCLKKNLEKITLEVLDRINWKSPSNRRKMASSI